MRALQRWVNSGRDPLEFDPDVDPLDLPDIEDDEDPLSEPEEPDFGDDEDEPEEPEGEPLPDEIPDLPFGPSEPTPGFDPPNPLDPEDRDPDRYYDQFGARTLPSTFDPRFFQGNPRLGNRPLRQRMGPRMPTPPRGGPFFGR